MKGMKGRRRHGWQAVGLPRFLRLQIGLAGVLLVLLGSCGGGGDGGSPFSAAPPPPALTITTASLADGLAGEAYSASVQASGGTGARTWSLAPGSGPLPPTLQLNSSNGQIAGTATTPGTFDFTVRVVDSSFPQQSDTQDLSITIGPMQITTTSLPPGTQGTFYSVTLARIGGTPSFNWIIALGNLPSGLVLNPATGDIRGTPDTVETPAFTVQLDDSGTPQQADTQALSITISAAGTLGRNDTTADATPLSNGTFRASISPFADPASSSSGNPDTDYYELTANTGAIVTVEIFAQRLFPASPLDPVIEILRADGTRFTTCRNEGTDDGVTGALDPTPTAFDDVCLNDDIRLGVITDSKLEFRVPGSSGTVTFFVHVLGWRGDARPDLVYSLTVSGAN